MINKGKIEKFTLGDIGWDKKAECGTGGWQDPSNPSDGRHEEFKKACLGRNGTHVIMKCEFESKHNHCEVCNTLETPKTVKADLGEGLKDYNVICAWRSYEYKPETWYYNLNLIIDNPKKCSANWGSPEIKECKFFY
jgi:hypothetical protein